MTTLKINGEEYNLEFSFAAADEGGLIHNMFKVISGAYFFSRGIEETMAAALMNGTAEMIGDLPTICKQAFHAGLKEHQEGISFDDAVELMKAYMKENKISFNAMYQILKAQMEEDGFFELTGITEMIQEMNKSEEAEETKENRNTPKVPQDHLRKSIGTK